ncbi:hypothetical protein E2C01_048805 [Portunus trituberculatus]|uniref:Uncharacterized protein n=1 Tax=Portunus trituberculatus TaxID=210409 RepID=A0A5B7GBH9_PORTR|nr:hypothetical protein [Portunus trituberculatus]
MSAGAGEVSGAGCGDGGQLAAPGAAEREGHRHNKSTGGGSLLHTLPSFPHKNMRKAILHRIFNFRPLPSSPIPCCIHINREQFLPRPIPSQAAPRSESRHCDNVMQIFRPQRKLDGGGSKHEGDDGGGCGVCGGGGGV